MFMDEPGTKKKQITIKINDQPIVVPISFLAYKEMKVYETNGKKEFKIECIDTDHDFPESVYF